MLRHVGIVVQNSNKYLKFLSKLGIEKISDEIEVGDFISHLVGLPNTKIRVVKLRFPEGGMLEILEYLNNEDKSSKIIKLANHIGISHIALKVDNIESTLEIFIKNDGRKINNIRINPEGTAKVVYCRDFYGNLFELVELLN